MDKFILSMVLLLPSILYPQWVERDSGTKQDLSGIFFLDDQFGWIVYPDSCLVTTDGGITWEAKKVSSGNTTLFDVAFSNPERGIATAENDTIYRSSDGGSSWGPVNTLSIGKNYFGVSFIENFGRHAWIVGSSETIAYSFDNGQLWKPQYSDFYTLRDVYFLDRDHGWAVGNNLTILYTEDGDADSSWIISQRNLSSDDLFGVWFPSPQTGWVVGQNGIILKSTDGGKTWPVQQNSGTQVDLKRVSFVDDFNGVIVGTNGTILHTKDGGITWPSESLPVEIDLEDVYCINLESCWALGERGKLLYSQGNIMLASPNGGEALQGNTEYLITWDSNYLEKVKIEFSCDNGDSYLPIITEAQNLDAALGVYPWMVPADINSNNCRIRIAGVAKPTVEDFSDQVFTIFKPDLEPPLIGDPTLAPGAPTKGQPFEISTRIVDDHGVSAILKFREGGAQNYKDKQMTPNPENMTEFTADIESHEVTISGIEYFIEATDSSFKKNIATLADSSNPIYIEVFTENETIEVSPSSPGDSEIYQMISIPLKLVRNTISQVLEAEGALGSYDRRKWRLFRWDPLAVNEKGGRGRYQEFKQSLSETTFEPGRAFWIALSNDFPDNLNTGFGHSVAPDDAKISLNGSGWHQISNPFVYKVFVHDSVLASHKLSRFAEYQPGDKSNPYRDTNFMEPYKGYFVYSESNQEDFTVPSIRAADSETAVKNALEILNWRIKLLVHSEQNILSKVVFGESSRSSAHFDYLDQISPPLLEKPEIETYIPHPDWPTFSGNYKKDIRFLKDSGDTWDFVVESDTEGLLKLQFEIDSRLPVTQEVTLIPKDSNFPQDLRQNPIYQYYSRGRNEKREFSLLVGPKGYSEDQVLQIRPTEFTLFQNYPNPFNPATTIRYSIPDVSTVTLKIFNLLGEEIVTLINSDERAAGYHTAVWDGKNRADRAVASGVYIYRLEAGSFSTSKKMILLR